MNLEIDLDALNLVAFTEDNSLCKCRYFSIGKEQNLIYSIKDLMSIKECRLNYEKVCILLQAIVELIDFLKQQNLYLRNIRVRTTDIYMLDGQFKFVYLPLQQKEDIPPEAFIIKILHIVHSADREVIHLKRRLKGLGTFELMKDYINTIGIKEKMEISMEECVCETEAETSLLNADEDIVSEDEGETTVLSQHITDFLPNEFSECETTVLSDAAMPDDGEIITKEGAYDLYLLRISSGGRIHINKPIYSIGKDVNQMDYVLGNASVSRNHATNDSV